MGAPQVEIRVDDDTGRWSVDAFPMILVPQHFFLNNHHAVEAELGPERLAEILRPSGHRSAFHWCEKEAALHGLDGPAAFHHYMKRLSQRGWAQFEPLAVDLEAATARIRVRHSVFLDEAPRTSGRKVCSMFASWFEGSLDYAAKAQGFDRRFAAREASCAAEGHQDHCLFEIVPRP